MIMPTSREFNSNFVCIKTLSTYLWIYFLVLLILLIHFKIQFCLGDGQGSINNSSWRNQLAGS